jgi:N-acetyl-gamma-glutamyl-phosphate reductase
MSIKAAIAGGAGYTGGELLRILLDHPECELTSVYSNSNAGNPLSAVHHDLEGITEMCFDGKPDTSADVLFLCMGHGESSAFLQRYPVSEHTKVIDLGQDFRLITQGNTFVYGLPELNKEQIIKARHIANPGCFATAIQLGLLPLAQAGITSEIYTTGITGSTGAGQGLSATSHFSWRSGNVQAYKSLSHQHLAEIGRSLSQVSGGREHLINFVPWRGGFPRGIYVSSVVECSLSIAEVETLYRTFYASSPFTHYSSRMIDMKQVVNTNRCLIHAEREGNKLVVHTAIDNLLKGASGQAVQNMNLAFGLDEATGLHLKSIAF